jgi:hypothetical protein
MLCGIADIKKDQAFETLCLLELFRKQMLVNLVMYNLLTLVL